MKERLSESDIRKLNLSFERHKAEAHVSINAHVRSRSIDLGQALEKRYAVYLDQRYWIIVRDVSLSRRTDSPSVDLTNLLGALVREGRIFCPISESVFIELLKQQDLKTRRSTAKLIDDLSLGVTLAPERLRIGTEIAHFFYSHGHRGSVYPLRCLVWSKLSYVLGVVIPITSAFGTEQERVLQKSFFDHMWNMSLTRIVDLLANSSVSADDFNVLAAKANSEIAAQAKELRSYKQAYDSDIGGALCLYMGVVREILEDMYKQASGLTPKLTEEQRHAHERELLRFFILAFRKSSIAKYLPTLHIIASCTAAIRWDKTRRITGNDLCDFHHAAAALAYCDIFLTEKPLQSLLTSNHVRLDKVAGCKVISAIPDAVDCLQQYINYKGV